MNNLVVCGCSFSDRTKVEYAWGDYLAESLGYSYTHLATGSGSDKRGIRLLTQAIMRGKVDTNSLVLFQLTGVERCELPSQLTQQEYVSSIAKADRTGPGPRVVERTWLYNLVSKFKMHSNTWQECEFDKTAHLYHEEWLVDEDFHAEELFTQHYSLVELCKSKTIKICYVSQQNAGFIHHIQHVLKNVDHRVNPLDYMIGDRYLENPWTDEEIFKWGLAPDDQSHLSTGGHIAFAETVHGWLRENKVIDE
jgi:hypothetical protein